MTAPLLTRRWAAVGLAAAAATAAGIAPRPDRAAALESDRGVGVPITVEAKPVGGFRPSESSRTRFGLLSFRGGLELSSSAKAFGGFSGLVMLDAEHFIAHSDRADWLTGRIVYQDTRPAGIADATMASMLGPDGRTLAARGWYDTESITADGGVLYVGIERVNRIVRFDYGRAGLAAPAQLVPVPPELRRLPNNKGLEALAFVPRKLPLGGTLIAIAERWLDAAGNLRAFLIGGATPGMFTIRRHEDFDISDATVLPSGDLLLLERRFTWMTGIAMRLRRIPLTAIAPGVLVDGTPLVHADMGYQIDNMEAVGWHRTAAGETVLTLLSDDNFSFIQRTLLLQFALVDE